MDPALALLAQQHGWSVAETGGGCTALEAVSADPNLRGLISDELSVPEHAEQQCVLGLYDADGGRVALFWCPTVIKAFEVFALIVP